MNIEKEDVVNYVMNTPWVGTQPVSVKGIKICQYEANYKVEFSNGDCVEYYTTIKEIKNDE